MTPKLLKKDTIQMSVAESTGSVGSPGTESGSSTLLPPFAKLARSAATAVICAVAIALIFRRPVFAFGLVGGLAICLLMYAGIYSFTTGTMKAITGVVAGKANISSGQFMPGFLLATVGKFIAIGIVMAVFVKLLHINLLMMLAGFLIAQIAVTVTCVVSLNAVPVLSGRR